MKLALLICGLVATADAFVVAPCRSAASRSRHHATRMMFGGGDKDEAGFMDKLKAAKDMFNPEMMKKYSEVGVKVQALQEELQATEIECSTGEGAIVVKVSGTQVPVSVTVSDAVCASGTEKAGADLTNALKQAHAKSGKYAQERMAALYDEMGLAGAMGGAKPP